VDSHHSVGDLTRTGPQVMQRDVHRAGDGSVDPLGIAANVQNNRCVRADPRRRRPRLSAGRRCGSVPRRSWSSHPRPARPSRSFRSPWVGNTRTSSGSRARRRADPC
jgi:hypothetical protein